MLFGLISSPSVQTCVCVCAPRALGIYQGSVHSLLCLSPHPGLCPHPMPQVSAPPEESLPQFPSLLLHPTMASFPVHIPSGPMPATLGQSLPAPWALCPAASFSKRQEDLIPCGLMFAWPRPQVGGETCAGVQARLQEGPSGPVLARLLCHSTSLLHLLRRLPSPGILTLPSLGKVAQTFSLPLFCRWGGPDKGLLGPSPEETPASLLSPPCSASQCPELP